MKRIWEIATEYATTYDRLTQDLSVDVAIVGAGITGLSAALRLVEAGKEVAVLESQRAGAGDTGGSTGNLYATTSLGLANIARKWNEQTVRDFVTARNTGLQDIESNIKQLEIDCQFSRQPLYRCLMGNDSQLERELEEEREASKAAGLDAEHAKPLSVPFTLEKALKLTDQAYFNPLVYVRALAEAVRLQGGSLYENTKVEKVAQRGGQLNTAHGVVKAKHIILATHTPLGINILQTEMEPLLEHGIAARLRNQDYPDGILWVMDGFYSVRSYRHKGHDYLIVVGEKHKTGHRSFGEEHYNQLRHFARKHFKVDQFVHHWSAQQFRPADLLPYIGRTPLANNVYVATGFAADGLTWGAVAGRVVSDMILQRENPWAGLFNPQRFTPIKSARAFLKQNSHVARHYVTGYLKPARRTELNKVRKGEGKIIKLDGEQRAVYRDEQGRVSVLSSVCTHMLCKVKWNGDDRTWDCPCHGSRFDTKGQVLEGPAIKALQQYSDEE